MLFDDFIQAIICHFFNFNTFLSIIDRNTISESGDWTRLTTMKVDFERAAWAKQPSILGGSPGLVVMGDSSCSWGCEFESWDHLLDGHDIFSHWFAVKIVLFVWKDQKYTIKEGRVGPVLKKQPSILFEGLFEHSFFIKMGHSGHLFLYFRLSIQLTVYNCSKIFADDWIRIADLWYWKWPLHQLSHNHCPIRT